MVPLNNLGEILMAKKSTKTANVAKVRSMAAFKAHITRWTNVLKSAKKADVKREAKEQIARINQNMRAA